MPERNERENYFNAQDAFGVNERWSIIKQIQGNENKNGSGFYRCSNLQTIRNVINLRMKCAFRTIDGEGKLWENTMYQKLKYVKTN